MVLQAVQLGEGFSQASSLYCRWISVERPHGTQLAAVWIDAEMRVFQNPSSAPGPDKESAEELVPGSAEL